MNGIFGPAYAASYDLFYAQKDYEAECDLLERAFSEFSPTPIARVLDLGCGTGGHAIPLARRGYEVTAVDRSPAMLATAKEKATKAGVNGRVSFVLADIRDFRSSVSHDAALMMFNVLGYQAHQVQLAAALAAVRNSLHAGGLFLFDFWHAGAVDREPPSERCRVFEQVGAQLTRRSSGQLDRAEETCMVTIQVSELVDGRAGNEITERHLIRYFQRGPLAKALMAAGMELLRCGSFPEYRLEPDIQQWSVFGVARASGSLLP